ncbi:hypothetical protein [Legionella longbeachae]|uniref:hypothetical protein n=1 Tax=Legionella longbeachae TaxID=450 RepID=UPI001243E5DA|nr:hypothetical protein [Legionella longbeachae]QEY49923.1 hypothetical protein FQU71_00930 [Legionella longbeachae]
MGKSLALLDVDHTLLFDDRLNMNLLDSLKERDIKDLYLFTDMTLKQSDMKDRKELIEKLEALGFNVLGVITPLDLVWDKVPAEEAEEFRAFVCKKGPKKLCGNDFNIFLNTEEVTSSYSFASTALNRPMKEVAFGIAYKEGMQSYLAGKNENEPIPNHIFERSYVAKILGDHIAQQAGYAHTKGLLLDAFMQNKPEWVSNIIIADDNQNVITSIAQYREKNQPTTPISAIHVNNEKVNKTFYQDAISNHLESDPLYSNAVTKTKGEEVPFQTSKKQILLSALEKLKKLCQSEDELDIAILRSNRIKLPGVQSGCKNAEVIDGYATLSTLKQLEVMDEQGMIQANKTIETGITVKKDFYSNLKMLLTDAQINLLSDEQKLIIDAIVYESIGVVLDPECEIARLINPEIFASLPSGEALMKEAFSTLDFELLFKNKDQFMKDIEKRIEDVAKNTETIIQSTYPSELLRVTESPDYSAVIKAINSQVKKYQPKLTEMKQNEDNSSQFTVPQVDKTNHNRVKIVTGLCAAAGLLIGAGIGVALVATGIFAPFGIGVLGAVAAAATIGGGLALIGGALGFGTAKLTKPPANGVAIDTKAADEIGLRSFRALAQLGSSAIQQSGFNNSSSNMDSLNQNIITLNHKQIDKKVADNDDVDLALSETADWRP